MTMLKRIVTITFFWLVLVPFSEQIFAQGTSNKKEAPLICTYCKKEIKKPDPSSIPQDFLAMDGSFPEGFLVVGETITDKPLCFECNRLPKCDLCQMPSKELSKTDGKNLCRYCRYSEKLITDSREAQKITDEVSRTLSAKFKMNLKNKVKVKLDTQENVSQQSKVIGIQGVYEGYNQKGEHQIIIVEELSNITFRSCAAHELTHAWCKENSISDTLASHSSIDYDNLDDQVLALYEGFAQFVSWCYLKDMEADLNKKVHDPNLAGLFPTRLILEFHTIENNPNKIYADGFRRVKAVMGTARTASEWKKIIQQEFKKETRKDTKKETKKDEKSETKKNAKKRT